MRRFFAFVAVLVACNGNGTSSDGSGGTGGAGGGSEGGAGPGGSGAGDSATLNFLVQEGANQGVVDAGVAVDFASGAPRREAITDMQGLVVFDDIDLADIASVIAHKDGYSFIALSGAFVRLNPLQSGAFLTRLPNLAALAEVTGMALNGADIASNLFNVSATAPDTLPFASQTPGTDSYSIRVTPGVDFTLLGFEIEPAVFMGQSVTAPIPSAWAMDVSGLSAGTNIDIDFAGPERVVLDSATVSFDEPSDVELANNGFAFVQVVAGNQNPVGYSVQSDKVGAAFSAEVHWYQPPGTSLSGQYIVISPFGSLALHQLAGAPVEGAIELSLLRPPNLVSAVNENNPHPLNGLLEWTVDDDPDRQLLVVTVFDEFATKGASILELNETSFVIPPLPSTSKSDVLFNGTQTSAFVWACTFEPNVGCTRFARDRIFSVALP